MIMEGPAQQKSAIREGKNWSHVSEDSRFAEESFTKEGSPERDSSLVPISP